MDRERALRLLDLSRQARWAFPSSSGRPVPPDAPPGVEALAMERDAFADAATVLVEHGHRPAATELAANVWRLFVLAREDAKGRAFLAMVLDRPGPTDLSRDRALALYGDGLLAFRLGDLAASRARCEAALSAAGTAADGEAEGLSLLGLSRVELSEGRPAKAREHAAAARSLLRPLGEAFVQAPLHMLAQATRLTGSTDEAAALFAESLALNRRLCDRGMVLVELHNLGHVELRRGNVAAAERCFSECAALDAANDDPYDVALRLFNRAAVALARDDHARASRLLDEAQEVLARENVSLATDDAHEFDDLRRRLAAGPSARGRADGGA